MAREDILTALQIALTQKEGPPPADDNTLIQKMIAPNETMTASDQGVTLTASDPTKFVWGGNNAQGQYISPGWKWSQGEYYKSYKGVILRDNPLAYYRLDETSGTVAHDASGNGFASNIGSGVTLGQTGPLDIGSLAMYFNGTTNGVINFGKLPLSSASISVEAWLKWDGTYPGGSWSIPITFGSNYDLAFSSTGNFGVNTGVSDCTGFDSTSMNGVWSHIIAVIPNNVAVTPANTKIYLNGVVQTLSLKTGSTPVAIPTNELIIGAYNGTGFPYRGDLAELAVYTAELTAQQALNHFNARKAVFN